MVRGTVGGDTSERIFLRGSHITEPYIYSAIEIRQEYYAH